MKRALRAALLSALAVWLAAWAAFPFDGAWRVATLDLALAAIVGTSALVAWTHGSPRTRRAFRWVGAGCMAWAAGQVIWTWYELVLGDVPTPSAADVAFSLSLPLFAIGLLSWPRGNPRWQRAHILNGVVLLAIVFAVGWEFILSPLVVEAAVDWPTLLRFAYPLGDVILLAAIGVGLGLDELEERGRLVTVAAGLLGLVIADTYFAFAGDAYRTGSVFDAGWAIGLAAVGLAGALPQRWTDRVHVGAMAVPLLALAAFGGVRGYQIAEVAPLIPMAAVIDAAIGLVIMMAIAIGYLALARSRLVQGRALEELHARLGRAYAQREAALESSRTGVCLFEPEGELVFYNSAWSRMLGPDSEHGEEWRDFVGSLVLDMAALADAGGEAAVRFRSSDERQLEVHAAALPDGHVIVSVDDVTDQAQALVARDRFLAQMVGAHDLEARRIAEVLHDDVVQRLTALSLRLELRAARDGDVALNALAAEASATTAAIRTLLVELHPAVLESQGLYAAVDVAARSLRELGVEVTVERLDQRLPQPVEQLAYRLIQEAFANVLKHADATQVKVAFSASAHRLHCRVVDNGAGFDPHEATTALGRGSIGLHLVRERIDLAGGRFLLESRRGRGTVFGFELPLAQPAQTAAAERAS